VSAKTIRTRHLRRSADLCQAIARRQRRVQLWMVRETLRVSTADAAERLLLYAGRFVAVAKRTPGVGRGGPGPDLTFARSTPARCQPAT
jgi:hypothetical protein